MTEKQKDMPWSEDPLRINKAALDLVCKLLGTTADSAPVNSVALGLLCKQLGMSADAYPTFCVDSDGDLLYYGGCWAGWTSVERMLTNRGLEFPTMA